jgi:hypothetical protein
LDSKSKGEEKKDLQEWKQAVKVKKIPIHLFGSASDQKSKIKTKHPSDTVDARKPE